MSNRSANNVFIIVRRSSVIFEFFAYMESINSIAVLDNDCGIVVVLLHTLFAYHVSI